MKKFKTEKYQLIKITEVECIKETEKSVWIKYKDWCGVLQEDQTLKNSKYYRFFDTRKEAETHLINNAKSKLEYLTTEIEKYTNVLKKLQS